MVEEGVRVGVLGVEFDSPTSLRRLMIHGMRGICTWCAAWLGLLGWLGLKALEGMALGYAWATARRSPGGPAQEVIRFRQQAAFKLAGHLHFCARAGSA